MHGYPRSTGTGPRDAAPSATRVRRAPRLPRRREYVDHASGARNDRVEYRAMLEAARRRPSMSSWSALRPLRPLDARARQRARRVRGPRHRLHRYNEGADTTTPQGRLLFGIMASLAEFERSLIAERVKAGMQRARAQGKHTGRPRLPEAKRKAILELLGRGGCRGGLSARSWASRTRSYGLSARPWVTVRLRRPGVLTVGPVTLRPQRNARGAARRSG